MAVKVENWNHDLSPWNAPAVFGTEDFGDGAENTLEEVLQLCTDNDRKYCIGGYSMAGLFALWAAMQTDRFKGVAATSPSVWFPGFLEDMKSRRVGSDCIYLSLGDKEEKTRNPVMAQVGNCIRETFTWLKEEGIPCTTCSFTEAHMEFGKPPYPKNAGTAPLSLMNSSAILSS